MKNLFERISATTKAVSSGPFDGLATVFSNLDLERLKRKTAELIEDPRRFFADSRLSLFRSASKLNCNYQLFDSDKVLRRMIKLLEDPERFLRDSNFSSLRSLGNLMRNSRLSK